MTEPGDGHLSAADELRAVEAEVMSCTRCPLAMGRTRAVPGAGSLAAEIMFIGEGPGYHEDRTGVPFVGAAGQLLDELLARIGVDRADVFITNIVKCRPPGNRNPESSEIQACRPYLDAQIEALDPLVVVTLGSFALAHFIPGARIMQVHGVARRVAGRLFLPTLHPAAALRRPEWRPLLAADFEALGRALAAPGVPDSPVPPVQPGLF